MTEAKVVHEDPLGRGSMVPEEVIERPPLPTEVVGSSGLIQFSGRINEEFLKDLDNEKGRRVFREMADNDPVVGAVLYSVDMLMRQVEWRIDPAEETADAYEVAEFVESCMTDMSFSWNDTLSSILSFLTYGWSYCELVYKVRGGLDTDDPKRRSEYDDGKIAWRQIALRPQDSLFRWEFDEDGGIAGMWQTAPPDWVPVFIPIQKALLFRTRSFKNNPEGRSVLRNAYRSWFMKKRIEEIEAIGIERDLAGLPIAWVPPTMLSDTATPEERAALGAIKDIVSSIKRDEQEGIVFPLAFDERGNRRYDLTLLSTGGRRQFETDAIVSRYDQRIAMTVLADFILLGHENVGSFALGSAKVDMFSVALGAWLDEIASVLNRYALPRLMELNNIDQQLQPVLSHEDVKRVDLADVAAYVQALTGSGMPLFPDSNLEEHLRGLANFPERDPKDEVDVATAPLPGAEQLVPHQVTLENPGHHQGNPPAPGAAMQPAAPPKGVTPPQLAPYAEATAQRAQKHAEHDQSSHAGGQGKLDLDGEQALAAEVRGKFDESDPLSNTQGFEGGALLGYDAGFQYADYGGEVYRRPPGGAFRWESSRSHFDTFKDKGAFPGFTEA